ncbi:hypothetical protein BH10PLA1_BH10PLA1_09770 [soil metagenome]
MRLLKISALSSLLIAALLLAGCNVIGAIAYKVTPLPKTPAKYKPDQDLAVVVVENSRNPGASEIDAQQIAMLVADELRKNKVVPLVDDSAVENLRDQDPKAFKKMSLPAIGRGVGAKQVIYVDLSRVQIEAAVADQMIKGSVDATVRVIDVHSGNLRFPVEAAQGWPVSMETPFLTVDEKTDETSLRRRLHDGLAISIGRLFYDWTNENDTRELK